MVPGAAGKWWSRVKEWRADVAREGQQHIGLEEEEGIRSLRPGAVPGQLKQSSVKPSLLRWRQCRLRTLSQAPPRGLRQKQRAPCLRRGPLERATLGKQPTILPSSYQPGAFSQTVRICSVSPGSTSRVKDVGRQGKLC